MTDTDRTVRARGAAGGPLVVAVQRLLPTRMLSSAAFFLARSRVRWWKNLLIRVFVKRYRVDLAEAQLTDARAYPCFNALFTRALSANARPQPTSPALLTSPVDGRLSALGAAADGRLIQAKGRDYSLLELLGGDEGLAADLDGGAFATVYLAPPDYHRVHMPCDGRLRAWRYVPGRLFSVNPASAAAIPNLFARNERLIARFDTAAGALALVMVGALLVGSLETVWAGRVTPPHRRGRLAQHYELIHPIGYRRGEEIARFNMGSTVILLAARDTVQWHQTLTEGQRLRVGMPLARLAGGIEDTRV